MEGDDDDTLAPALVVAAMAVQPRWPACRVSRGAFGVARAQVGLGAQWKCASLYPQSTGVLVHGASLVVALTALKFAHESRCMSESTWALYVLRYESRSDPSFVVPTLILNCHFPKSEF